MNARLALLAGLVFCAAPTIAATALETTGRLELPGTNVVAWWAISSATKIQPDRAPPANASAAVRLRSARNERECVQIILRSARPLRGFSIAALTLTGPGQHAIAPPDTEWLRAVYLDITTPTDKSTKAGLWPDPLVPFTGSADLDPGMNQAFWLRVFVPQGAAAGTYRGQLQLSAQGWAAEIPVELTVYNFSLPDRMTCQTAFGFSAGEVFRYQGLQTDAAKREVLGKYWANLAAHHISPYDPAPLDHFTVKWPDVRPPKSDWDRWQNLRLVTNEVRSGNTALLLYDDKVTANSAVTYQPLIPIPPKGLRVRGAYRTAVPGHRFLVTLNHFDADQNWMSGRNRDVALVGTGLWQMLEHVITDFPPGAAFVQLHLRATLWTEPGEKIGLVWFDDISIQNADTGEELVWGGDFEAKPRTELCAPAQQLKVAFDFEAWDRAMTKAFEQYHFNAFSIPIPGLGGGTFHELFEPELHGFGENTPEYPLLLGSYCRQVQDHLKAKGWIDKSYVYWFDEPSADQYPFLQRGFNKLKEYCPEIPRMITKLVEPGLIGGPNLWCPISHEYDHTSSNERRKLGERFWWYVCTGPKAPYAGLFLDHPAPEMRIWLWQTFQRDIDGILVWQCNYWNSGTAYPDPKKPQDPYADPMSWTSGYGTPEGQKQPWGNGDGRFIYPPVEAASGNPGKPVVAGPVDSIRWEHLRDGIEDYEYLVILRQKMKERGAALEPSARQEFEQLLAVPEKITRSMTEFTEDGAPIELRRDQVARAIEKL